MASHTEEQLDIFVKELSDYPTVVQEIVISDKGLIRNLDFGLTKEEVRGIEKTNFTQSDEMMQFLLAEADLSDEVSLDIEFHFTNNLLNEFVLIIYTTAKEQQTLIFKDIKEILTKKFQLKANTDQWVIDNKLHLSIRKAGNEQEFDIELIFKQL